MSIFTNVSSDNRLTVVMVSETPPETEGGVEVPGLMAAAERAVEIDLAPIAVSNRPPDLRPFEVLENPSEQHVVPLLLYVNTPRPIADVQRIPTETALEELVPLFAAQIPNARRQMRPHQPANPPPFDAFPILRLEHASLDHDFVADLRRILLLDLGLRRVVDGVVVEIIEERPRAIGRGIAGFFGIFGVGLA